MTEESRMDERERHDDRLEEVTVLSMEIDCFWIGTANSLEV